MEKTVKIYQDVRQEWPLSPKLNTHAHARALTHTHACTYAQRERERERERPVLHRTWTERKTVFSGKLLQSWGYCVRTVIKPPFMNRNCLIWKQKARTRLQQKIFSMLLFNFVLHCTFNMTVPVHCLLCITSEQNC